MPTAVQSDSFQLIRLFYWYINIHVNVGLWRLWQDNLSIDNCGGRSVNGLPPLKSYALDASPCLAKCGYFSTQEVFDTKWWLCGIDNLHKIQGLFRKLAEFCFIICTYKDFSMKLSEEKDVITIHLKKIRERTNTFHWYINSLLQWLRTQNPHMSEPHIVWYTHVLPLFMVCVCVTLLWNHFSKLWSLWLQLFT